MAEQSSGRIIGAEDLRRAFDESFTGPPVQGAGNREDFLMIRVFEARYAVRIRDLSGIERNRRIVPLPSKNPALLGVLGSEGRLVPVFKLAALLGEDSRGDEEEQVWVALCGRDEPVGLAFSSLVRHLRIVKSDIVSLEKDVFPYVKQALNLDSDAREHLPGSGRGGPGERGEALKMLYVLELPAIVSAIQLSAGVESLREE